MTANVADYETQIAAANQEVVKAENAVTVATQSVKEVQDELDILSEKISDL